MVRVVDIPEKGTPSVDPMDYDLSWTSVEQLKEMTELYGQQAFYYSTPKFKINFTQTNKIRILLGRYRNTGGYPVRFNHHVGYFSGIAMWIPDQYSIIGKESRRYWEIHGVDTRWKYVIILKTDVYDSLQQERDARTVGMFANFIPFGLGNLVLSETEINRSLLTMEARPIYENLIFYNTINDVLIWANWDKVLDDLIDIENLKYLPPETDIVSPIIQ